MVVCFRWWLRLGGGMGKDGLERSWAWISGGGDLLVKRGFLVLGFFVVLSGVFF